MRINCIKHASIECSLRKKYIRNCFRNIGDSYVARFFGNVTYVCVSRFSFFCGDIICHEFSSFPVTVMYFIAEITCGVRRTFVESLSGIIVICYYDSNNSNAKFKRRIKFVFFFIIHNY